MKIGFDGKRAMQNFTGLGNYSRYIIEILCRYYPHNEYILYVPKQRSNQMIESLLNLFHHLKITSPKRPYWKRFSSIWRIWGVSKQIQQDEIQIFHGLSNELPLNIHHAKGVKSVVTIHDLIFLLFPQYYPVIDRNIYTYKFKKACKNADKIIAISECTKRDIIQYFHIPEKKIKVIYQGCDASFQKTAPAELKKRAQKTYCLPERFILNVGSIEERKNILLIVQAMLHLPNDVHLVIIGKRTRYTEKIERFINDNGLVDRVHILSNVPFELLPAIYQQAEVFVYPSRYEGFGIPVIEALHSGTPVIAATGSCLEEAGGPDSIYIHPDNVEEATDALKEVLSSPEKKEEMISKGKEYVKRFAEEEQGRSLFHLYQELVQSE